MPKELEKEWLTMKEASVYLKFSIPTLYKYARNGEIVGVKKGNRWRFHRSVLDQWMKASLPVI